MRLLALLALAALGLPGLLPVPEPPVAGLDEVVRGQLAEARAEVDALLASPAPAAARLADAFGDLGSLFMAYDLPGAAAACLENARRLAGDEIRWPYLAGVLFEKDRRVDEALASFETARALDAADLATLIRLGEVHLERDEPEKARAVFERALELARGGAGEAAARAGLGAALAALGEHESAAAELEAALAAEPGASSLHYRLALVYRELGRIDDARRQLALRGPVEPSFPDPRLDEVRQLATGVGVHLLRGNRALGRGDAETALTEYRQAVDANPRSAPAHEALASALARSGDVEGALRHYGAAVEIESDNFLLQHNLGTLLARSGRPEEAVEHFRSALAIVPADPTVRYKLARNLARIGRLDEARREYRELLASEPEDAPSTGGADQYDAARFDLSELLFRSGRYREAADLLRELIAEDPGRSWARFSLGVTLEAAGDALGAMAQYRAVAEDGAADGDERARASDGLARLLMQAGHYAEARQALEAGLRTSPESALLTDLLARLLAACPDARVRDGERALALASGLYRKQPRPAYAATVAMALAELGRFDEAVEWQRRVVAEVEKDGDAARLAEARSHLELYERGEPCRTPWRQ